MAEKNKKKAQKVKKGKISFAELGVDELKKMQNEIKKELQEIRFNIVTGVVSNVKKTRNLKRDYARVLTFLNLYARKGSNQISVSK